MAHISESAVVENGADVITQEIAGANNPSNDFEMVNVARAQEPALQSDKTLKLGEISFCDSSGVEETEAKAAIFKKDSGPEAAIEILREWEIFKPKNKNEPELVITVTGGAGYFNMNSSVRKDFRDGLVDAATKSDALILTGGTFSGVMLHTGKALREKATVEINTIGFTSFSAIKDNEKMDEQFVGVTEDDLNKLEEAGKQKKRILPKYEYCYQEDGLKINKDNEKVSLDPNHTHHLIKKLDKSNKNQLGGHIEWWAEVEKLIRKELNCAGVLICVQGGLGTLDTCYNYLKNGTPLVVLNGTGRAADWIAKMIEEVNKPGVEAEIVDNLDNLDPDTDKQKIIDYSRKLIYEKWLKMAPTDSIDKEFFWKKTQDEGSTYPEQDNSLFYLGRILTFRKNIRAYSDKSLTNLSSMILESVINKVEINDTAPEFKELDDGLRFYASGVLGFNKVESAEFLRFLVDVSELHGDKVENRDSKEGLSENKTSEKKNCIYATDFAVFGL